MPSTCFSYQADMLQGISNRGAAQSAPPGLRKMTTTHCFSYPADMPSMRKMPAGCCFRYPATECFSYPGDAPGLLRSLAGGAYTRLCVF